MDIKEQLKMAVDNRNLKQNSVNTEVRKYINNYLENNLPKAISDNKRVLTLTVPCSKVTSVIWDELIEYSTNRSVTSKGSIIKDHVEDLYKPYLKKDETTLEIYESLLSFVDDIDEAISLSITFYLNQD